MRTTYSDYDRVAPWFTAESLYIQDRAANPVETTELCIMLWRNAVDIGYEILMDDFMRGAYYPMFVHRYTRFFYGYTDERLSTCMKRYIDYDKIYELLKNYKDILAQHRRAAGLPERICRWCRDYYCNSMCRDPGDRVRRRELF